MIPRQTTAAAHFRRRSRRCRNRVRDDEILELCGKGELGRDAVEELHIARLALEARVSARDEPRQIDEGLTLVKRERGP